MGKTKFTIDQPICAEIDFIYMLKRRNISMELFVIFLLIFDVIYYSDINHMLWLNIIFASSCFLLRDNHTKIKSDLEFLFAFASHLV